MYLVTKLNINIPIEYPAHAPTTKKATLTTLSNTTPIINPTTNGITLTRKARL